MRPGDGTCGAKTRSGTPCQSPPIRGRRRCRLHGGLTPFGIASPAWKDGRYSKYLPANRRGRYAEARSDPELLTLRDEIALVDTRTADVLSRLDAGESGGADSSAWAELRELIDQRRRLVEGEGKRLTQMQQYITAERAAALVSAVAEVVRRHVTDRDTLARISAGLGVLLDRDPDTPQADDG